jgi:hypothetical protein
MVPDPVVYSPFDEQDLSTTHIQKRSTRITHATVMNEFIADIDFDSEFKLMHALGVDAHASKFSHRGFNAHVSENAYALTLTSRINPISGETTVLNKILIALTAAAVLGSASAAFAYEDPENRIGDRYPFLEQIANPAATAKFGDRYLMRRQVANLNRFANEEPESKIADRYPFLEPRVAPQRRMTRMVTARSTFATGSIH